MPLKSHEARKLAAASIIAAAALGAVTAPANAATVPPKTLKYTCKYPLVDKQPLEILVTSNIPTEAKLNELQPAFVVNATATAGGNTSQAITTLNAQAIDGVSQATASLHFPSGFVQEDLLVDLTVDKWTRPAGPVPNPLVLTASGSTPAVVLDEVGETQIVLDSISLNLRALKADGTPINVKKLTTDFDGNPVPADTTPDDFSVYCKLDAGESNVIATIKVCEALPCEGGGGENTAPTAPTGVKVDSKTTNSVTLSWTPATDPDEGDSIKAYNVYEGDTKVATVTEPTATIDGLEPASTHTYTVEAVDSKDLAGPKSEGVEVTTDEETGGENQPPTAPTGVKVDSKTTTSATLSWTAATDPDEGDSVASYNVYEGDTKVATVDGTTATIDGLEPASTHTYTVEAVDSQGLAGPKSEGVEVTTDEETGGENQPPTAPTGVTVSGKTTTSLTLSWTAATDPDEGDSVASYNVYEGDTKVATVTEPTATIEGLEPGSSHTYTVDAVDSQGLAGPQSEAVTGTTDEETGGENQPPTAPTGVKVDSKSATSVNLSWTAATDPDEGDSVASYNVYEGDTKVASGAGTTASITGLAPESTHSYTVEAVDSQGLAGPRSEAVSVTTDPEGTTPGGDTLKYALKGSTSLKTLTRGNLPLAGGIVAKPDFAEGTFEADLTLNNTSGRLVAAGFLPITAKVGFVPIGKTTGTLDDATATTPAGITTNSKVRIKVLEVKLFGAIPLAGGNNCQTKQASDINLKSTNAFDPFKGGSIAGTYKISDLNGCGPLNGLVSPLTAGGGNTIKLDLTYQP